MPPPPPLRQHESIIHPTPFVETDPNRLIITTQRIIQIAEEGRKELEARNITFLGRRSDRPGLPLVILCVLAGLPFLIIGGLKAWKIKDKLPPPLKVSCGERPKPAQEAADPKDAKDPKARRKKKKKEVVAKKKSKEEIAWEEECVKKKKDRRRGFQAVGLLLVAGIFGYGAKRFLKEKHYVLVVAGPGNTMDIPTKDDNDLKQIMTLIQGAQKAALSMPAA